MSELRSALDELRAEDVRSLSDAGLASDLDELERAGRVIEAERGRRLVEVDRRKTYAAVGHLSAAAWLAHRQGLSRRGAEAAVRRAQALDRMPQVAEAFADEGPTLRRFRPRARGRATRIRKRTSHITIVVSDQAEEN